MARVRRQFCLCGHRSRGGRCVARRTQAHQRVPHPSGVSEPSFRNRPVALHAQAQRPRSGARPRHDPAGLLHHEAQRHLNEIDPADPGRNSRKPASVRAAQARPRAITRCSSGCNWSSWLRDITGAGSAGLAAAEFRRAGRICRSIGDPQLSRRARRSASQGLPDPFLGARHQPGLCQHGRHGRGGRGLRQQGRRRRR